MLRDEATRFGPKAAGGLATQTSATSMARCHLRGSRPLVLFSLVISLLNTSSRSLSFDRDRCPFSSWCHSYIQPQPKEA